MRCADDDGLPCGVCVVGDLSAALAFGCCHYYYYTCAYYMYDPALYYLFQTNPSVVPLKLTRNSLGNLPIYAKANKEIHLTPLT